MAAPGTTVQERHVIRALHTIAHRLDFERRRCRALEARFGCGGPSIAAALLEARQAEERAVLDLRDAVVHLATLVPPVRRD